MASTRGPIIEPEDKTPDEPVHIRLRPEIARDLRAYQQYVNSSVHYVVSAALRRLFAADKEFKMFKDEQLVAVNPMNDSPERKRRGRPKSNLNSRQSHDPETA